MNLWIHEDEVFMDSIEEFKKYMACEYKCHCQCIDDEGIIMFECHMDLIDMNCLANELNKDLIMTMGGTIMTKYLYEQLGF